MKQLMQLAVGALVFAALCTPVAASETEELPHWGYFGQSDVLTPDQWGSVEPYADCTLNSQSPINIETSSVVEADLDLEIDYNGDQVSYNNNGHSVVVSPARTLTTPDGGEYQLAQFHFHTLSENTVNGEHFDMEMHMVHTAGKNLAVLGVFITEGEKNKVLANVFEHLPHDAGHDAEALMADLIDDYAGLLPENRSFFSFEGSLTTPPCSEGVKWFVFEHPIEMSAEQIAAFRELFQEEGNLYDTNRPVQALNGRDILYTPAD